MTVNQRGITRIVFVFKNFVVKIPRFTYSWEHFLKGLIANMHEGKTWKYCKYSKQDRKLLCPVIWHSWGGWILIMKRADVKRHMEEVYALPPLPEGTDSEKELQARYKKWIDEGFGGDDKCDSYGYIGNNLVKIDYGQS